ncbi:MULTISPECIES: collagen-like protein [unclassified Pseudomonas]|uniref:collagen-like protein n=1 Tax=unclassified Pseudomonas TaxID=196821 RepID=UPI002AC8CCC0|nr:MULTISPECIES: collagen-like protein [unclassified Pseudomonas]MEB0045806.1 collagen-like protein [Pseudomonas sp. Dout3]MEB0096706.1 collagen-like protein [Pseudomonas sp. DC1.2]WPX60174.1 collagen-like protein [Pseudomonas sp. DC1.2]
MRKLCLLAALISPLACAQVVSVETNSLMRLPNTASTLQLERLEVADYGTLLIPSNVTEVTVGELRLGREARIAIVPSEQPLELKVERAELSEGSLITARGAPGTYLKAARSGRNLNVQFKVLKAAQLTVDARGGAGTPGFFGLDGANGQEPGCTWGQAGHGADGSNGTDGQSGAPGALVRLQVPRDYPAERIAVQVAGGAGGLPGPGGKPGAGGKAKGCFVYKTDGAKSGRPGLDGQPGPVGAAGSVTIQRF